MWFKPKLTVILLVIAGFGLITYLYLRPVPPAQPTSQVVKPPKTQAVELSWPGVGQAAIGAQKYGLLESHNASAPVPIASVTKVITALAILKQKPLLFGQQGPVLTLDSTDVGYYNSYASQGGSVAKVEAGETISEYQALQAMMLPSANNMADSLSRWAFGSTQAYVSYANQMVKSLGLNQTTISDASGFGDSTTSTAADLVKIGLAALQDPVFSQIVNQPTATVPVAGEVTNLNWLLGKDGVNGIKTGFTDVAGGCYLLAATHQIAGKNITFVSAVIGAPDLDSAIDSAHNLVQSADNGFENLTIIHKDQLMGRYTSKWGGTAKVIAAKDLSLLVWKGKDIKIISGLDSIQTPVKAGTQVSQVSVESDGQAANASLIISKNLKSPSPIWRIIR